MNLSRSAEVLFLRFFLFLLIISLAMPKRASAGLGITSPPPEVVKAFNLSPFYKKFLDAGGLPIVASEKVSDYALLEARYIINNMLAGREDIRKALIAHKIRVAIMAPAELTTNIPEHSDLEPKEYWDRRARGLGATLERPAVSCGEENLLCYPGDPYFGENILIHEFAHAIHEIALADIDPTFDSRLKEAFEESKKEGLWQGTYSGTNHHEYWAEGVQIWFNAGASLLGDHNFVSTREQLKAYDPRLAKLLEEVFPNNNWAWIPPIVRGDLAHLKGIDFSKSPKFAWPKELEEAFKKFSERVEKEARSPLTDTVSVSKKMRTWSLRNGKQVQALFVREANGFAVLRDGEGKLIGIKLEELSVPDLQYIANIRELSNDFRIWHLSNIDADKSAPPELKAKLPQTLTASFLKIVGIDARFSEAVLVLITEDLKKVSYPLRIFSSEDQEYAKRKDEERKARLPKPSGEYSICWDECAYNPEKDKGSFKYVTTPHFIFFYGNDKNGSGKALFEEPGFLERNQRYFEQLWNFYETEMGVKMPYSNSSKKCKIPVYITGTGLPQHKEGWAFGAHDLVLHPGAMGDGSSVVPHEFTHCMQFHLGGFRNSPYVGWFWETHANWSSHQWHPGYPPVLEGYAERAHYELNSSRMNYGSWPFLQYLAEHPFFGPSFCYEIWEKNRKNEKDESIEDPFQTIMRLGKEKGIFHNEVKDFGDIIGELAGHMANWDFVHKYFYQRTMINHQRNISQAGRWRVLLQPVPDRPMWYRPIYSHSPRQYGINIIDLIRNPSAEEVEVRFEGIGDEVEGSDWRVTLVAIDDKGECRYSPMLRGSKGTIKMRLKPNEQRLALAIAATPSFYKPMQFRPGYNMKRRHPYEVFFKGCYPSPFPPLPPSPQVSGHRHPNGGGFVAETAFVAPTAYVAPNAKVLGNARVEGNARIEDYAVVKDSALVSDNAIISDFAVVCGRAKVLENARVRGCAMVSDNVTLKGNARVLEYAYLLGDGVVSGNVLVKGFGEIMTNKNTELTGGIVAGEDLEVWLVDYPKPKIEYGLIYGYNNREILERELRDNKYLYAYWDFSRPRRQLLLDSFADNDGTLRGNPSFGKEGNRTFIQLNGRNQYALVEGHIVDSPETTIDCWLYREGEGKQCLFAFMGRDSLLAFYPSNEDNKAELRLMKDGKVESVIAQKSVEMGKWTRVTIMMGNGEGRIYIDGKLVGEGRLELKPEDIEARYGYIGRDVRGGYFKGRIGGLAVFRKAWGSVEEMPQPAEIVKEVKSVPPTP